MLPPVDVEDFTVYISDLREALGRVTTDLVAESHQEFVEELLFHEVNQVLMGIGFRNQGRADFYCNQCRPDLILSNPHNLRSEIFCLPTTDNYNLTATQCNIVTEFLDIERYPLIARLMNVCISVEL